MSVLSFNPTRSSRSPFAAVAGLWSEAVQAWRFRQAGRAMHGLSDEMLHDIGVARSEIEEVTRHGRRVRR